MSSLYSSSSGNFTASGTWSLVDSTSLLDSNAASTATTTSFVYSQTFTPGAITIDGVAIKIATRGSNTGTISVDFFNNTGTVSVATVTINCADMTAGANGWYFFKFASPVTLLAATLYQVGIRTSTAGTVTVSRNATAGNWCRMLRTTTNQAPAAGDQMVIGGDYSSAGVGSSYVVTMDNTNTTSFGAYAATYPESICIASHGTLLFGTSAATNYTLKFKGIMVISAGGTLNTGTTGTPMPSGSTANILFDVTTNVDSGILIQSNATWNGRGNAIANVKALLAADVIVGATSLTASISTGWVTGDSICIASTTRTVGQCEAKAMSGNASGATIPIAALTNAHSGTSPTQAEIGNLTRNVTVKGTSSTLQGYIATATGSTVNLQYLEFAFLGSATGSKTGFDIQVTTIGSVNVQFCSFHDFVVAGSVAFNCINNSNDNITFSNNVLFNVITGIQIVQTSGANITFDNNLILTAIGSCMIMGDVGITITNNTCAGSPSSLTLNEVGGFITNCSGNTCHSGNAGLALNGPTGGTISNTTAWRNNTGGLILQALTSGVLLDGVTLFGNLSQNITLGLCGEITLNNVTANSDAAFATANGILMANNIVTGNIYLNNSVFGGTLSHGATDFSVNNTGNAPRLFLQNTAFLSTSAISGQLMLGVGSFVAAEKYQQTTGNNRTYSIYGVLTLDAVIYDVSPSARLAPNNAALKYKGPIFSAAVASGTTLTASIKVRKSVIGDGTAYNGNQPRLFVQANPALGINADTLLATATNAANGAFQTISGTTATASEDGVLNFYVDCDGTAGWVNIDTAAVT